MCSASNELWQPILMHSSGRCASLETTVSPFLLMGFFGLPHAHILQPYEEQQPHFAYSQLPDCRYRPAPQQPAVWGVGCSSAWRCHLS